MNTKEKHMLTKTEAQKLVDRMNALTSRNMVKAMTQSEEFAELREKLFAGGWVMLAEKCEQMKDGRLTCRMRLTTPDDPEWADLPCE